jgi:hypothetical protein
VPSNDGGMEHASSREITGLIPSGEPSWCMNQAKRRVIFLARRIAGADPLDAG